MIVWIETREGFKSADGRFRLFPSGPHGRRWNLYINGVRQRRWYRTDVAAKKAAEGL